MKLRLSLIGALALVLSAVVALGTPAAAGAANTASAANTAKFPVRGTTTKGAPVVGTFNIKHFKRVNKTIRAVGTFTGAVDGKHVTSTPAWARVKSINGTPTRQMAGAGAAGAQANCT